jgi:surface protein
MKKATILFYFISILAYSQTKITNNNFVFAVKECLSTNPVDGLCSKSEYGAMPDWDVSNVSIMAGFFFWDPYDDLAEVFNVDISAWDVSNVTDMRYLFKSMKSFNQDISKWNVGKVKNMSQMFKDTRSFNQDISSWDVSSVTDMRKMFAGTISFNQDLSSWDVGNVTTCYNFIDSSTKWKFSKPDFPEKCK